jgi:hypothetical protein
LGCVAGSHAKSPGSGRVGHRTTDALEKPLGRLRRRSSPSGSTARSAASNPGVRARRVPDEAVDRGPSRPLGDNTAGIETWPDAGETSHGGYLTPGASVGGINLHGVPTPTSRSRRRPTIRPVRGTDPYHAERDKGANPSRYRPTLSVSDQLMPRYRRHALARRVSGSRRSQAPRVSVRRSPEPPP